jgi:hypothetical protein
MKLVKFLAAANCNVSGGSLYGWDCYGPNAQYLDICDKDNNEIGGCIFDRQTQEVYEVEVEDVETSKMYCWRDLKFAEEYEEEAKRRQVDLDQDINMVYVEEIILDVVKGLCGVEDSVMFDAAEPDEFTTEHMDEDEPPHIEDDEFAASAAAAEAEFDRILEAEREAQRNNKTYMVTIEMTHEIEVTAATMEDAASKATEFVKAMKPHGANFDNTVGWIDTYVSKETVSRKLAVLNVEM